MNGDEIENEPMLKEDEDGKSDQQPSSTPSSY